MHVQVEIEYSAVPPPEEVESVRRAGIALALDSNTVSVRRTQTDRGRPSIILDFEVKTQPQYKAVDHVYHTVHLYIGGKFYSDMVIRFPKKARTGESPDLGRAWEEWLTTLLA